MISKFLLQFQMVVVRGSGLLVIAKKKKNTCERTAVAEYICQQYLGLTLRSFVTGLVSASVTGATKPCVNQVVDIVGAAVLNFNVD